MPITHQEALLRCIEHREIFHDEMLHLFRQIMSGEMSPVMVAALTMGLRVKKETIGEIAGAARTGRALDLQYPWTADQSGRRAEYFDGCLPRRPGRHPGARIAAPRRAARHRGLWPRQYG